MLTLRKIGKICQRFRREQGYNQTRVAADTGYTAENISAFENGRNDNGKILMWYVLHGMSAEYIRECIEYGED